ncbi:hypothetical protein RHSIM_Rhsim04G0042800 [Rhododendron simsii]|uniref:F-box domain-containing protein n=1 Tax=Rhododendron simsii TaxID=118357 RepID=A0A834H3N5_RHOSS|nr:hypothetical protein RHSIM_Rhsim04G0042800 [Rhododendron simsii]
MKRSRSSKLPVNAATGSSIFSIPSCLLMEILSKLPMSTICNCRCVCSYFRNLISDPQFAQLHLSTSQPSLMFWDRRWDCIVHLEGERFQPFPGPSQFCGLPGQLRVEMMKMGVLKDGLSVFHHPNCYMLDIWVMKGYAVRESWTKDFVIKLPWVATYFGYIYQPLMVLNNGVILMVYALSVLFSCNTMDKNSIRKFMVNGISSFTRAMMYIPSFVSIKNVARGRYS